jgi:arsenite methyltransferase
MDAKHIYEKVQEHYSLAANGPSGEYGHKVAKAFGYTDDELVDIPRDANLGLSCGNPFAIAKLKEVSLAMRLSLWTNERGLIDGNRVRQ